MRKICVIIGHGGNDSGAVNIHTGDTELKYNTGLSVMVADLLRNRGYNADIYNRGYARVENVPELNAKKYDLFISLHCNSFNEQANGTEMLYWSTSSRSKKLAQSLQDEVVKTFSLTDRGIKPKVNGDRGAYLLKKTNAPCVILEPFFIDNMHDLEVGKAKKQEYSQAIVNGIDKYFNN